MSHKNFIKKSLLHAICITIFTGISAIQTITILGVPQAQYAQITEQTKKICIPMELQKGDFVYKDYIQISADHPDIEISNWDIDIEPVSYFSKEFRETKKICNTNFTITVYTKNKASVHTNNTNNKKDSTAHNSAHKSVKDAHIHLSYYLNSKGGMVEKTIPFDITTSHTELEEVETHIDTQVITEQKTNSSNKTSQKNSNKSWTEYLQDLVKKTDSIWIRIILALALGILLSLTPCIYPMIPITVGILQSQGSKSITSNFFLSFVYVMGIAITFAVLGLIAAFTGQIFGTILTNPIFVLIVVTFLVYLALSMLGFYEIYIPRFMQKTGNSSGKKSILSIFLFGIASGSIASPCVSPGLVLLLSIVTALGSKILGFLLLFAFGLGLGAPLLLVGTFSGSINKLPKAGMWMLEIKKIFGLLLFGVCFYFLSNIMPLTLLLFLLASFMLAMGIFYLANVKPYDSKFWKLFKSTTGITFCALSIYVAFNGYKTLYLQKTIALSFWQKKYSTALEQAKKENKKLLIDFWTPACSICKAIDKKVFTDQTVIDALKRIFVNVKVDGSDITTEPFKSLKEEYKIMGFPTFLLIDPHNGSVIKRWSSEFYTMSNAEILKELESLQ